MSQQSRAPEATLRDGALKAAIWRNPGDNGDLYSVSITRTWQDKSGQYHETSRFSPTECLKVSQLAQRACDKVAGLRQDSNQYRQANQQVFEQGGQNPGGYGQDRGPRR